MKKLLLTLIVSLAFCGSIFAQMGVNPNGYESHWPDFYDPDYANQQAFVAAIQINGQLVTMDDDNWMALEVAAFIGDDECRGNLMFLTDEYIVWYEDPYLTIDGFPIFYNDAIEDTVYFKMFDHMNNVEYDLCQVLYGGETFTVLTGYEYVQGWDDPNDPIILNFVTGGFTRDIAAYGNAEDRDHYYLISSPVGAVDADQVDLLLSNDYDFYYFDETQEKEWMNYKGDETLSFDGGFGLEPGKGYLYANSGDSENDTITLTFNGTAYEETTNTSEFSYALSYAGTGDTKGWNLVGNPFSVAAYVDLPYYVMNEGGSNLIAVEDTDEPLPAMEGCFVVATPQDQSVEFTINSRNAKRAALALNLSNGRGVIDRAIVRFGEGSQLPKFQLWDDTKVYIPMDSEDYAVVNSEGMGEMPVNFKAAENGSYSLAASSTEVSFSYLHLIDNMTGADVDLLATPSYSFDARTTDYASRFRLVFATGSSVDGDSFGFVNAAGNLCIFGIEGEATLQVMDVTGRILGTETFSGSYEKQLNVAPGVYMLRLTNGNNVKVQKMVVR